MPNGSSRGHQGQLHNESSRRHQGQLRKGASLGHDNRFSESDLHAGTVFTADLKQLLNDVGNWEQCHKEFETALTGTALSAHIKDGTGPIAHAVGTRFNHRIGSAGGIGYAAHAYLQRLEEILEGLIETAQRYAQADETHANELAAQSDQDGVA